MNVVLDISSVIWDKERYDADVSCYYQLAEEFLQFTEAFKKVDVKLMMRSDLLAEMMNSFPFDLTQNTPYFKEFKTLAWRFLSQISDTTEYEANVLPDLKTIPNIFYNHYSKTALLECKYLVYEMHTTTNHLAFCTFSAIWKDDSLKTQCNTKTKEHDTVIHPSEDIESYIGRFKKVFEHNPKHDRIIKRRRDNGEEVSPLSCFDGKDNSKPQKLLDTSQRIDDETEKKFYNYDDENQTYVCFTPHRENVNKYHGFDINKEQVPAEIKKIFHK